MELKLNIYKRGQIVKTYTTTTYDITLGTCEDLLAILGLEKFASEEALAQLEVSKVIDLVVKNYDKFIELLHDIFPDLTEEERRHIKLIELKDLLVGIAKDTINRLFNLNKGKN